MAFLLYGVHYPRPDKELLLVQAMHTFGDLVKKQRGVVFVDTFRNTKDGTIISMAIWESEEAFKASWPDLLKRAPSQEWEVQPREALTMASA
jgi:hypothetical protein